MAGEFEEVQSEVKEKKPCWLKLTNWESGSLKSRGKFY